MVRSRPVPVQPFRPLSLEQIPSESRAAFAPILRNLNPFLVSVSEALANGLTYAANLSAQVQQLDVTLPDDRVFVGQPSGPAFANSFVLNADATFEALHFRKLLGGDVQVRGLARAPGVLPGSGTNMFAVPTVGSAALWTPSLARGPFAGVGGGETLFSWDLSAAGFARYRAGGATGAFLSFDSTYTPADRSAPPLAAPLSYPSLLSGSVAGLSVLNSFVLDPNNKGVPLAGGTVGPVAVQWTEVVQASGRTVKITGLQGIQPQRATRLWLLTVTG